MYSAILSHRVQYRTIDKKGSKQFKRSFIDNRATTQKSNSISTIIQRASLEDWINGARKDKNEPITLYTHILNDGFGDAGQLGYLVDKMNSLQLGRKIVPYATHEHEDSNNKQTIMALSRISEQEKLKTPKELHQKQPISGWIPECTNSWEIQYPVPAQSSKDNNHILRINEMGKFQPLKYRSESGETIYHTGIVPLRSDRKDMAIGYGMPIFMPKQDLYNAMLSSIKLDRNQLKDALLVKVPTQNDINNILSKAKGNNFNTVILLGVTDDETLKAVLGENFEDMTIRSKKFLPQEILTLLMSEIGKDDGKGMIFSAGEGMYVHALATSKAPVGNLIRNDRYEYQLFQISSDSNMLGTGIQNLPPINLAMMGLDQKALKQHSDNVRKCNWFDILDKIKN